MYYLARNWMPPVHPNLLLKNLIFVPLAVILNNGGSHSALDYQTSIEIEYVGCAHTWSR